MSRGKRRRRLPKEEGGVEESASGPAASGPGTKPLLVLLVFGFGFAVLLVSLFVFQGDDTSKEDGSSGVPPGFVATVHSPTGNAVSISEAEFERIVERESGRVLKTVPQRGNERLEDVQATVLGELLKEVWNQEEAQALGISVSGEEVAAELAEIKAEDYPTEAAYQGYLRESKSTSQDVEREIRRQLLSAKVQEQAVGPVSSEKPDYADAEFDAEFRGRWKSRTECATGFLQLEGSGGFLGAGYEIEEHCRGGTKGKGAIKETLEQVKKMEAEGQP
jgi:hypothetical protein